jgi:uncharacterized protein (DUF849 family)
MTDTTRQADAAAGAPEMPEPEMWQWTHFAPSNISLGASRLSLDPVKSTRRAFPLDRDGEVWARTEVTELYTADQLRAYGQAMAEHARRAALDEWRTLAREVVGQLKAGQNGDAPGHAHRRPGIWDEHNGERSGKPCAWCRAWAKFEQLAAAQTQGGA